MNKRFSTLLAAALVAGGMSANAAIAVKGSVITDKIYTSPARNYMLSTAAVTGADEAVASVIAVNGEKAEVITADAADLNAQLWTMKVTTVAGSNRFVFVNKVDGTTLSFDPKNAVAADATGKVTPPTNAADKAFSLVEASNDTEWTWVSAANATATDLAKLTGIVNAFKADSSMAVGVTSTGELFAYKYANNTTPSLQSSAKALELQAVVPGTVAMKAADLNVLGTGANKYFTLSTNKTGLVGGDALIGRKFHAVDDVNSNGYVRLQNLKDDAIVNTFAYVDTAFHVGSGTNENVWYKFANMNKEDERDFLVDSAFVFKIDRDLFKDSVTVSVTKKALKKKAATGNAANGSFWQEDQTEATLLTYLTVSAIKLTANTEVLTLYEAPKDENLLFSVSSPDADNTLTSLEDGVYYITNDKGQYLAMPIYAAEGEYHAAQRWVTVNPTEQDPAHMPAYQWVVLKDKTSDKAAATSTLTFVNREFASKLYYNNGVSLVANEWAAIQLRKNEGADYYYGKGHGLFRGVDSLDFKAVPAAALSDSLLGYKNFDANDMLVNRYTFNYLHAYAMDKFIAKSAKDSLATVLDGKGIFALEAQDGILDYGYPVTKAVTDRIKGLKQLKRQAYKVYVPGKNKAYLGVSGERKYSISSYNEGNGNVSLFFFKENNDLEGDGNCYHAMIDLTQYEAGDVTEFAYAKAGVADDDLSATLKKQVYSESRTSAFLIAPYDAPLYRRFDSEKLEGNAGDAADTLRFKEMYRNEYLQVENNPNFTVKGIDFLGIYTPDFTKDGKSFIVDTAFVNRFNGNIKPQYLISIDRQDKVATAGVPCDATNHKHVDANGKETDADHCVHATPATLGFAFGKYLVNFADSVTSATANKTAYAWKGYTRAGFVKAAHIGDSLYILNGQFADVTAETFDAAAIHKAIKDGKYDKNYLVNLIAGGDDHQKVTWSMRFVDPTNAANEVEEDRAFLMESQNEDDEKIAPVIGQWLKMQNGCIVLSGTNENGQSTFDQFTGADDALIFNVEQGAKEDLATDNETIATSEVAVIAGEGQVTIANAAGKKVVISNILGQVVANTVIVSDNAVITAPQGVVVVAVEGEAAVKAIVK